MLFKTPKEFFDTAESVGRITRDEELDLANRMREGDASAKDKLTTAYLPVLASYVRRYSREPSEEFIRRAVETLTDAVSGFADEKKDYCSTVVIPEDVSRAIPQSRLAEIEALLKEDPRPSYRDDKDREYGMYYAGYEISFTATDSTLTVTSIKKH